MPARHFIALDSWRGIAALMVAVYHFTTASMLSKSMLVQYSWLFVDFFFVLSGFVIAANYRERLAQGFAPERFMLLRLGRLYPLHAVMLAAFVATELMLYLASGAMTVGSGRAFFSGPTAVSGIFTTLLLVQGLGFKEGTAWNGVSWSISTELWAYAVFALLASQFAKHLTLAMGAVIAVSLPVVMPGVLGEATEPFINIARCLYGFCVGALLHDAYTWLSREKRAVLPSDTGFTLLELAAAGLAIAFVVTASALPAHALAPLAFGPAVLVYAFDRGWISRLLQAPLFQLLGMLSYSIYMTHEFVQSRMMLPVAMALQKLAGVPLVRIEKAGDGSAYVWGSSEWQGELAAVLMILLVVAFSQLTYRLIEAPGRDGMRRFVARRYQGAPVAA
jgi:peptidoglycan/LPS O-acetylase OafA/YrhL